MKRATPSKSTARRKLLFTGDWARGSLETTRYRPWLLSWHASVAGTLESPELPGVGPTEAVPGAASGSPRPGV